MNPRHSLFVSGELTAFFEGKEARGCELLVFEFYQIK